MTRPGNQEDGKEVSHATLEDFEAVNWQGAIADIASGHMHDFTGRFYVRGSEAAELGDARAARVFYCLSDVCSLSLQLDAMKAPYAPGSLLGALRSAALDDISTQSIDAFRGLADKVNNPHVRARLADVAWVRRRDIALARTAIAAYLSIASSIRPDCWPKHMRALERAAQVASQLGRESDDHVQVRDFVLKKLAEVETTDNGLLSAKLMEILYTYDGGDAEKLAVASRALAGRGMSAGDNHRARTYLELAAKWYQRAANPTGRREALKKLAGTYLADADRKATHGSKVMAANDLTRAIEAFRRAGDSRDEVERTMARLTDTQQEAVSELGVFSHSIDITDAVAAADASAKGMELSQALVVLATCTSVPKRAELRKKVEERAGQFMFLSLMPKVLLNREGKVVGRQGSITLRDSSEREATVRAEMLELGRQYHEVTARATIDPIRRRIVAEHQLRVADLYPIVSQNPLVPEGREEIFAAGLHAGFSGDLLTAASILLPQIEHSIRVLLHRNGVRVTALDQYGIQQEMSLNKLLYLPELRDILDDDRIFALQGLLVEEFGSNLRNKCAHGLLEHAEFYSLQVLYTWWLVFHLCMTPVLVKLSRQATAADQPHRPGEELSSLAASES